MTTTHTSGAADLPEALINIAREIEALKRYCGMDPESAIAIQNGRYMAISSKIRALAAGQATAAPAQPAAQQGVAYAALPDEREMLKHALWVASSFTVHRYLMSNAEGRWSGAEKAACHDELCRLYVAVFRGVEVDQARVGLEADWMAVHDATQELTDHMDAVIGFPLKGVPDYDALAPKFFDHFHRLATHTLRASHGQAPTDAKALAEADRRAGEAERLLATCKEYVMRFEQARSRMKYQWGAEQRVSFDEVWDEALALKKAAQAAPQAADSAQEDAARLDFLIDQGAYVVSDPDTCTGHWLHWARPDGSTWVQCDEHPTPRAAIDAARKQGASHD